MAKKKNQTKKHKFKYSEPEGAVVGASRESVRPAPNEIQAHQGRSPVAAAAVGARNFSYVAGDLRRVGLLAAALTILEIALWLAFTHTGLGNAVYHLVQV